MLLVGKPDYNLRSGREVDWLKPFEIIAGHFVLLAWFGLKLGNQKETDLLVHLWSYQKMFWLLQKMMTKTLLALSYPYQGDGFDAPMI